MEDKEILDMVDEVVKLSVQRCNLSTKILFTEDETEITLLKLKLLSIEERYNKLINILGEDCERVNEVYKQYRSKRNDKRKIKRTNQTI